MLSRHLSPHVAEALTDTRIVLVTGPRQAGKTTLVKALSNHERPHITLDDTARVRAVRADPIGFIRDHPRAIIDEIQRVPELLLAIKQSVDENPGPGRYLITGSSDVMALPTVVDSLAGRLESFTLLPFSQSEIKQTRSTFLQAVFDGHVPRQNEICAGKELIEKVISGSYPGALSRIDARRRSAWYRSYRQSLTSRDVRDQWDVRPPELLAKLVNLAAVYAGQTLRITQLGVGLQINHQTAAKYLKILEQIFLIYLLPPWSTNFLSRITKSPKLHFLDIGVLGQLLGATPTNLAHNRQIFRPLLEGFVFTEIRKLISFSGDEIRMFHYRDQNGEREVDIILEQTDGGIVGIEVKSSSSITKKDFSSLQHLADSLGENFRLGLVLCEHESVMSFGPNLKTAPVSSLWGSA